MSSKTSTLPVHSEAAFFKQTEIAREALKTFNTISVLNAPGPVRIAMEELINATVRSQSSTTVFYPLRTFLGGLQLVRFPIFITPRLSRNSAAGLLHIGNLH